jgi:hypothetical protein
MFFSAWHKLRHRNTGPRAGRRSACLPQLEALEDRLLPAPWAGVGSVRAAAAGALGGPPARGSSGSTVGNQMTVTVNANAAPSVIDLGPVFAAMGGLQNEDGLQLSMLGNTNPGLVTTDLSETELTLTYVPGQSGTATITVGATDADGVSARETLFVTIVPAHPAAPAGASSIPAGAGPSPPATA